jgi:hypothetical protein
MLFILILLVPPQFYDYVKVQYSGRHAHDELRLVNDVLTLMHDIQKYDVKKI